MSRQAEVVVSRHFHIIQNDIKFWPHLRDSGGLLSRQLKRRKKHYLWANANRKATYLALISTSAKCVKNVGCQHQLVSCSRFESFIIKYPLSL